MAGNAPNNERDPFIVAEKKVMFAAIIIVLLLMAYIMVASIQEMPASVPSQQLVLKTPASSETKKPADTAQEIAVKFLVSGRITQMFFVEHAQVKKGDILASLDRTPFEEALASARAQLQLVTAEYNKPTIIPTTAYNAIETARAAVEKAKYNYDITHAELEKRGKLLVAGETDNVYDDDVQNERDAELNLESKRRELARQQEIAANNPGQYVDKSAIQAAQMNVVIAETNLNDTQLLAPADGIIASRVSEIGATITTDSTIYILSIPLTAVSN